MQLRAKDESLRSMRSATVRDCFRNGRVAKHEKDILTLVESRDLSEQRNWPLRFHDVADDFVIAEEDDPRKNNVNYSVVHQLPIEDDDDNDDDDDGKYNTPSLHESPLVAISRLPLQSLTIPPVREELNNITLNNKRLKTDPFVYKHGSFRSTDNVHISYTESSCYQTENRNLTQHYSLLPYEYLHTNASLKHSRKTHLQFSNRGAANKQKTYDIEPCEAEHCDKDELLENTKYFQCCQWHNLKLICFIVFITLIIFLLVGTLTYAAVFYINSESSTNNASSTSSTISPPIPTYQSTSIKPSTTASTSVNERKLTMRQSQICGRIPKYFTRTKLPKKTHMSSRFKNIFKGPIDVKRPNFFHIINTTSLMSKIATTPTVHKSFTMESNIPTTKVYSSDYDLRTKNSSFRKFLHSPEIKNKHLPEVHAHHRVRRVIDGTDATTGLVPWQACLCIIADENQEEFLCGGTIIAAGWILTAAHCAEDYVFAESWIVYVGLVNMSKIGGPLVQRRLVSHIIFHDKYDSKDSWHDYDVLLFKLDQDLVFTDYIQPICLPPQGFEFPKKAESYVSGWGYTYNLKKGFKHTPMLQRAQINLINFRICNKWYRNNLTPRMLCAGEIQGGKDSCTGDSGGPLSYYNKEDDVWILVAIVSSGDGCGLAKSPGIYAKISAFSNWIWTVIENPQAFYG